MSSNIFEEALLLAAGGIVALIVSAVVAADDEEEQAGETQKESRERIEAMFAALRKEAEQAIADCETEEERAAVCENIRQSIQQLQDNLADHGTSVKERLKEFDRLLSNVGEMMRAPMADGDGFTAGQASMRHILRGRL